MAADRVAEQVEQWRNDLVDLTRRNRLLNVRPGARSSDLLIVEPGAEEILARLLGGSGRQAQWRFHYPPLDDETLDDPALKAALESEDTELTPEREPDELLTDLVSARSLSAKLHTLERKAGQEFLDKGLRVLYLGLGLLQWADLDGTAMQSPVLMVPVTLSRRSPRDPYRLGGTDDDLSVNPALAVKLDTDFGLELPGLDDPANALAVLDNVTRAVAGQPGWQVTRGAVLGAFSFHKESMYRDLEHNHAAVVDHLLVRALSGDVVDDGTLDVDPIPDDQLDEVVPPETMASILDADSTQRRCIAAARDGRSFVMDGPPGTGKSQTIANMISELMVAGRTVLFVSEKAAALEVVRNRLANAGLGSFVLELHSHKATRKELAKALGVALGERVRVRDAVELDDAEVAKAQRLRRELTAYANAQNEVRQPLGLSLHTAIGRRAALDGVPAAPIPTSVDATFGAADHEAVIALSERLAGAWGPVADGPVFVWRDLVDPAGTQQRLTSVAVELGAALDSLRRLREVADAVAGQLRLDPPTDDAAADRLAAVVALLGSRPSVPVGWLTARDAGALSTRVDELEAMIGAERAAVAYLDSWGATWHGLAPGHESILDQRVGALRVGDAPIDLPPATPTSAIVATEQYLAWLAAEAPALLVTSDALADQLGLDRPRTPAAIAALAPLARSAGAAHKPDAAWFDESARTAARSAVAALAPVLEQHRSIDAHLRSVFLPSVFQLDIESFYEGPQDLVPNLGRLSGDGRANRRQLKACVPDGDISDEVVATLPLIRQWHQTQAQLVTVEATHAPALGSWFRGTDTDLAGAAAALDLAEQVSGLLRGLGVDVVSPSLVDLVRSSGPVADRLVADADALTARIDQWTRSLATRPFLAGSVLATWAVDDVGRWAHAQIEPLRAVLAELESIHLVAGRELTIDTARQFAAGRSTVAAAEAAFTDLAADDRARFGHLYAGPDTDTAAIRRGLAWCASVRPHLPGPVPEPVAAAVLAAAIPPDELAAAVVAWRAATSTVVSWFAEPHASTVRADLTSGFDDAAALLAELRDTTGQVDEWVTHAGAVAGLAERGLGATVDHLVADRSEARAVAPAIERAVLSAWIDAVLATDERCQPIRSGERDQLVAEYRDLDQRMGRHAAAQVMKACNERRPSTAVGEASIIRREAEKKTRHRPIRTLLAEAGRVSQQLKPCFMMSPLSVSQFLPPDLTFDVVIFDEASQVRPGDAIGSIYRGRQLIVAGDNRQLPPTSFFDRIGDIDDVYDEGALDIFDSVLDLCRSAAQVPDLPLRWHYRSRHESLITFSNREFYGGQLVTYPGAITDGDDIGVVFRHVPGAVYERGGARDNPVEAKVVVERVLWFAEHHPGLSVGVVAFSEAQATRIGWEIETARRDRPDLDGWFQEDRLDGFFVKNLENVQGDERDVIIFSVGYGFDEAGKLTMNFGPLNQEGGHRRLNVAVTRARQRVEVVSSITAADIRETPSDGVRHFKRYLDYAERGAEALVAVDDGSGAPAGAPAGVGGGPESPFEEAVLDTLRGWGHDVVSQVGHAGYRIDLGIRHPDQPGRFALGIECDGAAYHSSAVARDRDRLRQDVLEGLGWRLHRIWGPSWYRDRSGEEARLRQAIAEAIAPEPPDEVDEAAGSVEAVGEDGEISAAVAGAPIDAPPAVDAGPSAVGAPEPAVPEPTVPEPAVPEPAVPEPGVPEPAVPEPAVPEPGSVAADPIDLDVASPAASSDPAGPANAEPDDVIVERIDLDGPPTWVRPYVVATLVARTGHAGIDDIRSRVDLHTDLVAVVDVEGPVHRDRCAEALREPWAITRMTAKVRRAIDESLESLVGQGALVIVANSFVARPHQTVPSVRGAVDGDDRTVRKVAEIPPAELALALESLVADSHTISEGDLTAGIARLFGWSRRGADINATLTRALAQLEAAGLVQRDDRGRLSVRPT